MSSARIYAEHMRLVFHSSSWELKFFYCLCFTLDEVKRVGKRSGWERDPAIIFSKNVFSKMSCAVDGAFVSAKIFARGIGYILHSE
jgi:hypothetical protein